jgi:hypothetical protein
MNTALLIASWSGLAPDAAPTNSLLAMCLVLAVVVGLGGVVAAGQRPRVKADRHEDAGGNAKVFTLSLGQETVMLDPSKPWVHVDRYKWVTRGLIEEPQSFHVLPDGTVEINGEKIRLDDPEGVAKLELEINKHHTSIASRKPASVSPATAPQAQGPAALKVRFKVRLDHLGHLMIGCVQGAERTETSLRGLNTLIQNGMMLKPAHLHVDPLQRGVEIDGVQFESSEAGARKLEETLNDRYAPTLKPDQENAVEIRDNPASPTGFDIHFITVRVGARFDVKGHLTQEQLDVLQNPAKCNLLQPGIVLRISPPHLIVRRKRSDGGEERIPAMPDLNYLRATTQQLQQFLNHPLIRRTGGASAEEALAATELHPEEILQLNVIRQAKDKLVFWLECVTLRGGKFPWRALTHHNVAELQRSGVFLPHFDVTLSLDNRTLSLLNSENHQEETFALEPGSSDADLARAGRMLTAALKPAKARPVARDAAAPIGLVPAPMPVPESRTAVTAPTVEQRPQPSSPAPLPALGSSPPPKPIAIVPGGEKTVGKPGEQTGAKTPIATSTTSAATRVSPSPHGPAPPGGAENQAAPVPAGSVLDPAVLALFGQTDPLRVNVEIFRRLADRFDVAVQDVRFSLPRVFEDRRFEILSFGGQEIDSVLELRNEAFYGFYLSHISERRIDFVYACGGTHIEWGPDKCVLQPSANAEAIEFAGSALLALAQTRDNQFVFIVTSAYKQWVKPYESRCHAAFAQFLAVNDLAADPDTHMQDWVWQGWVR